MSVQRKFFRYDNLEACGEKVTNKLLFLFCLLLTWLLTACSRETPKLTRTYIPVSYQNETVLWRKEPSSKTVHSVYLNKSYETNHKLAVFWINDEYEHLFSKNHPVIKVNNHDIYKLQQYLNAILNIYYISIDNKNRISSDKVLHSVQKHLNCQPLSNLELRFLFNSESDIVFQKKPLTILLISSHELLLQTGALPIFPEVLSPYLRKKHNLPKLKSLEETNLFATKNVSIVYSTNISGFVFCRKTPSIQSQ